jgi:thymidine phosphorylase
MVRVKIGDKIEEGSRLFDVHVEKDSDFDLVFEKLKNAVEISTEPVEAPPFFWDVLGVD